MPAVARKALDITGRSHPCKLRRGSIPRCDMDAPFADSAEQGNPSVPVLRLHDDGGTVDLPRAAAEPKSPTGASHLREASSGREPGPGAGENDTGASSATDSAGLSCRSTRSAGSGIVRSTLRQSSEGGSHSAPRRRRDWRILGRTSATPRMDHIARATGDAHGAFVGSPGAAAPCRNPLKTSVRAERRRSSCNESWRGCDRWRSGPRVERRVPARGKPARTTRARASRSAYRCPLTRSSRRTGLAADETRRYLRWVGD